MTLLESIRPASASAHPSDRSRHSTRCSLEYDDLEPRQLLSTIVPTPAQQAAITPASNTPGPVAPAGDLTSIGNSATPSTSSSVVTQSVGEVGSLQSSLALNNFPANLSDTNVAVYTTPTYDSVATGLASDPIGPLLPASVTEQETPLDNGTDMTGTVWITPPPVPTGVFHPDITTSPVFTNQHAQTINPQGGTPSYTHFGQSATASMNGVVSQQPTATGPLGPSITNEVEPVQPPAESAHQPAGTPSQLQQDQTTPQPSAITPAGGTQGTTQPGSPTQGTAPGQQEGTTQSPAQGTQPSHETAPGNGPLPDSTTQPNPPAPQAGAQGAPSAGAAALLAPTIDGSIFDQDDTLDLIDASITSLASSTEADSSQPVDDGHLAAAFGVAAIAAGGYHLALASARGLKRPHVAGPDIPGDHNSTR